MGVRVSGVFCFCEAFVFFPKELFVYEWVAVIQDVRNYKRIILIIILFPWCFGEKDPNAYKNVNNKYKKQINKNKTGNDILVIS